MKQAVAVWGVGRLVHDAMYEGVAGDLRYRRSRGGGSVWNTLANIASHGLPVAGIGVGGDDSRARLARADNEHLGVDMREILTLPGLPTVTMHHFQTSRTPGQFVTRARCVRCSRRPRSRVLDARSAWPALSRFTCSAPAVLLVDRLVDPAVEFARARRSTGWTTVVDIGYPGYLHFKTAQGLRRALGAFDLVVMQAPVARFLATRIGPDFAQLLETIVVVSDGERGLSGIDGRRDPAPRFEVAAPVCEVIDTVGAGDALMAGIVAAMIESGHTHGPITASAAQVRQWCASAVSAIPPVLAAVGARGHLPGDGIHLSADDESGCFVCGATEDVSGR